MAMSGDLEALEQHAKKVVNKIRKENGKRALGKLKKGIPNHIKACTVAMSLEGVPGYEAVSPAIWMDRDQEMCEFMFQFDKGKYPHLEIPLSKIRKKEGRKMVEIG